jgi:hypothetical protein
LENLKGRDHSEDLDIDGKIKIALREVGWELVDMIHVA